MNQTLTNFNFFKKNGPLLVLLFALLSFQQGYGQHCIPGFHFSTDQSTVTFDDHSTGGGHHYNPHHGEPMIKAIQDDETGHHHKPEGNANQVSLHLSPRMGDHPFHLNTVYTAAAGYSYKVSRLEYYVSEISITHDGGQVLELNDVWLLVNPATDSLYDLGLLDVEQVEGIEFSLGVDQAHNHLDPATYPTGHPLAPQNPSMHWGWTSGYRFVAFEGQAGVNGNTNNVFEVHTIGDGNYKTVTLPTGAELAGNTLTIHLKADYGGLLNNINVSGGMVSHASTGASATIINNLKNVVFSAETSGIMDPAFAGSFTVSPNPAPADAVRVSYDLPAGPAYRLTITDLTGRQVLARTLSAGINTAGLEYNLNSGLYFIHLWQNGQPVVVEKLVVSE